jgi:quercetin dioxygenase-like cupin family protein
MAEQFGYHRGHYGRLEGTNVKSNITVVPFGQASPPHSTKHEHILYMLEGEVEFLLSPDRTPYLLTKYDSLFIPAEVRYEYSNVGRVDAYMIAISGMVGGASAPATYYIPGEDEPREYHRPATKHLRDR